MTKKIFHSIFTVALVVLLASIGIATSFLYDYFNDSQVKQLKAELSLVADTVNEVGVEYFENFDSTVFRFTVVDTDGTVLYDTQAKPSEMDNHADREEIAEAFKRYAWEEAEHAAKFAELLGEVVWNTKTNLEKRKDAECGACEDKMRIAARAKQLNLDAIHDTVHEMAKDEARHGKGFEGLYNRYFKK